MKKFAISVMLMLILSVFAIAAPTPLPVSIQVYGDPNQAYSVQITNLGSRYIKTLQTNDMGFLFIDSWMDLDNRIVPGDQLQFVVAGQTFTQTWNGDIDIVALLYLSGYQPPVTTTTTTIEAITTTTTIPVTTTIETTTTTTVPTTTTTTLPGVCPECQACPQFSIEAVVTIIISLVVGGGIGVKFYKGTSGEGKVLHKHPGIISYHDPNTTHAKVKIRHKKGEVFPKYENGEYRG